MTYEEAEKALVESLTLEQKREMYCETYTDIQYLNHLISRMGLTHSGWDVKQPFTVRLLNEKKETVGEALSLMKSLIVHKRKDVKLLEALADEKYLLRGDDAKKRMNDWHYFYKTSDFVIKLGSAWCVYIVTPPITDEMKENVRLMLPE